MLADHQVKFQNVLLAALVAFTRNVDLICLDGTFNLINYWDFLKLS